MSAAADAVPPGAGAAGESARSTETAVVGAGISGLSCAFELARAGRDLLVLDAAPRAGGVIASERRDGFLLEHGPHTVPAHARAFRELCADLGLAERLVASRPEASARYLFHRGRLVALPRGLRGLLRTPLLSTRAKLRLFTEPLRRYHPPAGEDEPTLETFLEERIGREATRTLAGAFARGVHAAEVEELGAWSAFPRLHELALRHGSLARGALAAARAGAATPPPGPSFPRGTLVSFPEGLAELPAALARELGSRLLLGARLRSIERLGARWRLDLDHAPPIEAERVVLTLPAPQTAALLEPLAPGAAALRTLRHADLSIVHLGLAGELPPGFGFLVPPDERGPSVPSALGILFPSHVFAGRAPKGHCLATAILRTIPGEDDGAVAARAAHDLALATGDLREPRLAVVRRWSEVIPRYAPGHAHRMSHLATEIERALADLHLAGSYRGGVSVEDRIASGRALGRRLAAGA